MASGAGASVTIAPDGGSISFANIQGFLSGLGIGFGQQNIVRTFISVAISNLNISVGQGTMAVETAAEILSEVVEDIAEAAAAGIPAPIDLRDTPPTTDQLPEPNMWEHVSQVNGVFFPTSWLDYYDLIEAGYVEGVNLYPPGSGATGGIFVPDVTAAPAPNTGTPNTTGDDMGWFDDAYYWVDETLFGGDLPGGADPGMPGGGAGTAFFPGGPATGPVPAPGGGGGNLPPAVIPPASGGYCGPSGSMAAPVWKKVCGQYKWVYSKRRRRKRLASKGDLADLAALKGILGGGKAFEVWIATHS